MPIKVNRVAVVIALPSALMCGGGWAILGAIAGGAIGKLGYDSSMILPGLVAGILGGVWSGVREYRSIINDPSLQPSLGLNRHQQNE